MGLRISNLIDCSFCANYKDGCTCSIEDIRKLYSLHGKQTAQNCTEFMNERTPLSSEIPHDKALVFMLAGCSEFIMVSGKTGTKLRYRLDKKTSTRSDGNEFIYWLNTSNSNETMTYAGVLFFDSNDNQFKFGKGARGKLTIGDIKVKSILYVLNNLYNNRFNINVKIYHVGKCGKCAKKLTDPVSILTGLGPKCAKDCGVPRAKVLKEEIKG